MHALGLCGWRAGFAALPLCGNLLDSPMFVQEGKAPLQLTLPPPTQYVQEHGGRGLRGEVGGRSRCRFCVSSTGMVRTSTGTVQAQYRFCTPSTGTVQFHFACFSARPVPVLYEPKPVLCEFGFGTCRETSQYRYWDLSTGTGI